MPAATENLPSRSFNYLAFLQGNLPSPGEEPGSDGEYLAGQCLDQLNLLDNPEQFPPRLLILLLSPAYSKAKAARLLAGIHSRLKKEGLKDVPLIGSSVGGVIVNSEVQVEGALLVCLASRLVTAKVVAEAEARTRPDKKVESMFSRLLDREAPRSRNPDLNPMGNRWLLTFLPGYSPSHDAGSYRAPEMHSEMFKRAMGRFAIVGGVSSLGDAAAAEEPMQFCGREVFSGAAVGALLECDVPAATSIAHGFEITDELLRVDDLSEDGRIISRFSGDLRPPAEVLGLGQKPILLGQMSAEGRLVTIEPTALADGRISLQRPVERNIIFQVLKPAQTTLEQVTQQAVETSMQRAQVENPVGAFLIFCRGLHLHQEQLGFSVSRAVSVFHETINRETCVGGLFDGEIGLDFEGKAQFTNWSASAVVFGDEMRERALVQRGFEAQVKHGPELMKATSLAKLVEHCLQLVWHTGFPGAMLSLTFKDASGGWIIAQDAVGTKLKRIVNETRRKLEGNDLLAAVARKGEPEFIPWLAAHPDAEKQAATKSKAISQYVIPLKRADERTFAILQIDLGDIRSRRAFGSRQTQLLDALGDEIAEALARFIGDQELRIARALDEALIQCLSLRSEAEAIERFLKMAVETIGTGQGHIRFSDKTRSHLVLKAGIGAYFEAAKRDRSAIPILERSPTVRAFLENEVRVFNTAATSPRRKKVIESFGDRSDLIAAIQSHHSYASVPLHDDDGGAIGALTVCALQPWFFNEFVVNSLTDLGRRFDFLIQHIRRRLADETKRSRLEFLNLVGLDLANAARFDTPCEALRDAVGRLAKACNAAVGSIYIHDEETGTLILRAQHNWVTGDAWIKAARYDIGEGWTGGAVYRALQPIYVADLNEYKQKGQLGSGSKYASPMFGGQPDEGIITAGIGLPLRVGSKAIGVAVFYRRWSRACKSQSPGFATVDLEDLGGAMDNLSALVHILLVKDKTDRREEEQAKRDSVLKALVEQSRHERWPFIQEILRAYKGVQADLYLPKRDGSLTSLVWEAGGTRRPSTNECSPRDKPITPDRLLRETIGTDHAKFERTELGHETPQDLQKPDKLATVGLVIRACVPLNVPEGDWHGVLDLRWNSRRIHSARRLTYHLPEHLKMLGEQIAGTLRHQQLDAEKEQLRRRAETNDRAVRAMGAMLLQSSHRTFNLLQDIRQFPKLIRIANSAEARGVEIQDLERAIGEGIKLIDRPREVVGRIRASRRQAVFLMSALAQALHDVCGSMSMRGSMDACVPTVAEDLAVWADPEMIRAAFVNVVHNAAKFCADGQGQLIIRAEALPATGMVRVEFVDTGPGMDGAEKKAALTGFFSTHSSLGVGVLISRLLTECSDGVFELQSEKGKGTTVLITLPQFTGQKT